MAYFETAVNSKKKIYVGMSFHALNIITISLYHLYVLKSKTIIIIIMPANIYNDQVDLKSYRGTCSNDVIHIA